MTDGAEAATGAEDASRYPRVGQRQRICCWLASAVWGACGCASDSKCARQTSAALLFQHYLRGESSRCSLASARTGCAIGAGANQRSICGLCSLLFPPWESQAPTLRSNSKSDVSVERGGFIFCDLSSRSRTWRSASASCAGLIAFFTAFLLPVSCSSATQYHT